MVRLVRTKLLEDDEGVCYFRDNIVLVLCAVLGGVHALKALWSLVAVYVLLFVAALGCRRKPYYAAVLGIMISLASVLLQWRDIVSASLSVELVIHCVPGLLVGLCIYIYRTQDAFQEDLNHLESLRYKLKTV